MRGGEPSPLAGGVNSGPDMLPLVAVLNVPTDWVGWLDLHMIAGCFHEDLLERSAASVTRLSWRGDS